MGHACIWMYTASIRSYLRSCPSETSGQAGLSLDSGKRGRREHRLADIPLVNRNKRSLDGRPRGKRHAPPSFSPGLVYE